MTSVSPSLTLLAREHFSEDRPPSKYDGAERDNYAAPNPPRCITITSAARTRRRLLVNPGSHDPQSGEIVSPIRRPSGCRPAASSSTFEWPGERCDRLGPDRTPISFCWGLRDRLC